MRADEIAVAHTPPGGYGRDMRADGSAEHGVYGVAAASGPVFAARSERTA